MIDWGVFSVAGLATLTGALGVVLSSNPVHSALMLILTLFSVAVLFVAQEAHFLAAVQVIVYAGAILVLFLFVLMLLNVQQEEREKDARPIQRWVGSIAIVVFGAAFVSILAASGSDVPARAAFDRVAAGDIAALSRRLFSDYLFAFEAVSVLLLAALVGAFVLAQKEKKP